LEAWQVCSAQGWRGAQFDPDVQAAVERSCGVLKKVKDHRSNQTGLKTQPQQKLELTRRPISYRCCVQRQIYPAEV
jgi:hypothetical protein